MLIGPWPGPMSLVVRPLRTNALKVLVEDETYAIIRVCFEVSNDVGSKILFVRFVVDFSSDPRDFCSMESRPVERGSGSGARAGAPVVAITGLWRMLEDR